MATATASTPNDQIGTYGVIDEATYHCRLVTSTAGAVDTTKTWVPAGQTIVKTATKTGRYTLTLPVAYERLLNIIVTPIGPDDAVWGANTTGLQWFVRDEDVSRTINVATSAQDGTVEIQFAQVSNADAELPDGASVMLTVIVARGKTF